MMRSSGAPAGTVEWSGLRYLERRTTMEKLKPCPYCGIMAKLEDVEDRT